MSRQKSQRASVSKSRGAKASRGASSQLDVTALFAGVGGMELGLAKAGHTVSSFCEIDPEAATVLANRFSGIPLIRDVRKTAELMEAISRKSNLVTAGFPCTDLSQAGTTKGFAGERSSLIRDVFRLLKRRPFANVLIENVPNWRMLHKGAYLEEVLTALERLGYKWAYRTIDARAFGRPQRRLRIFLFASQDRDPRSALFHGDEAPGDQTWSLDERAHGFYWTEGARGLGWGEDCVPTLKGGSAIGIPAAPAIVLPSLDVITPAIEDAEKLQGLKPGWTDFQSSIDGAPFKSRRRWLLVGNAVSVDVATWIGANLARPDAVDCEDGVQLKPGQAWPSSAWFDGSKRYAVPLSTWPVKRKQMPLADFLEFEGTPLSERATSGFLTRYRSSSLSFKADFAMALEAHLKGWKSGVRLAA